MAAEVKISADNSQLISRLDQAIAKLDQFAGKAKKANASAGAISSKEAARNVKDFFDPVSAGALSKLGAAGVGMYAAARAAQAFRNQVESLSKAEYLSSEQRAQMGQIASQFSHIDEVVGRMKAAAIAGVFDFLSGGDFSKAAQATATGAAGKRVSIATETLTAAEEAAAYEVLDTQGKIAFTKEKIASIDAQIAEEQNKTSSGTLAAFESQERILKLETKRIAVQREMASQQKAADKEAESKREKAASEALRAAKEMQAGEEKLTNARERYVELTETAQGKVNRLLKERDAIQLQAAGTEAESASRLQLEIQYQETANKLVEAQNALEREQTARLKDSNDERDKAIKLQQSQQAAKDALEDDIGIASTDDPKLKARRQRMKSIKDDATRIMEQTGMGSEDAMKAAIQLNPAQGGDEEESGRGRRSSFDGVRAKIKGYSGRQRASNPFLNAMSVNKSFGEFFNNPQRDAAKAKADANAKQKAEGSKDYFEVMRDQLTELQKLTSY